MKTLVKEKEGFKIYFEALEEFIPVKDIFSEPEDIEETIKKLDSGEWVIFCAQVTAVKNGVELASDYLGGCIYESEEDFYNTKGCYFDDMTNTVIEEAKETIKALNDSINVMGSFDENGDVNF